MNGVDKFVESNNLVNCICFSVNLGFRLIDLLDYGIFNMTSETWLKIKFIATKTVGPLTVIDDTVKLVTGETIFW